MNEEPLFQEALAKFRELEPGSILWRQGVRYNKRKTTWRRAC
jgi:hypothetical protein